MLDNKLIIFGPWCGEFSYEIKWWIPEIRKVKNEQFKDWDAIAIGFDGRKVLYEDFTDAYISYPKEINDTLTYPATYGEHIAGKGDIIPDNLKEFATNIARHYQEQGYMDIKIWWPNTIPISAERTLSDTIFGETKHYSARKEILDSIRKEIKFDNNRDTIAIMARNRCRNGIVDRETWNPEHWMTLIEKIIIELKLNIVFINLESKGSSGGSYNFSDHPICKKYEKNIKQINIAGENSVEIQFAILQNTICSIFGATGSAFLACLVNSNLFTQQTKENGYRLNVEFDQMKNNLDSDDIDLKRPYIFDKYDYANFWDSSPIELFDEFKKYYLTLLTEKKL